MALRPPLGVFARFAVVIIGRVLSGCCRGRFRRCWIAHQPVEVRTGPQHDVILWHEFVGIALASALSEPLAEDLLQSWGRAEEAPWPGPDQAAIPNRPTTKVA